jgi:hypothetical protein
MPIDRDAQDERLSRIEQMLEDLRREVRRFSDFHQQTLEEARITRDQSEASRSEIRKAIATARSIRASIKRKPKS